MRVALASLAPMSGHNAPPRSDSGPAHTKRAGLGSLAVAVARAGACGGPPAQTAHLGWSLEQARVIRLAAAALHEERVSPGAARSVEPPRGRQLDIDLGVRGKQLGIAFITGDERAKLGPAVPAHDVGSTAPLLVRAQAMRILVLHDLANKTDEQHGGERAVSSVVVERRLQRDVKDFVVQARRQGWR